MTKWHGIKSFLTGCFAKRSEKTGICYGLIYSFDDVEINLSCGNAIVCAPCDSHPIMISESRLITSSLAFLFKAAAGLSDLTERDANLC